MNVAQARGVAFEMNSRGVWTTVGDGRRYGAWEALEDVASALGYANWSDYNDACVENPADVERRLKAL
jgi:hypothetical protein